MAGLRVLGFLLVTLIFISGSLAVDTSYSKLCSQKSVTSVSCMGATHDGYFMKHPDDCKLFYYCSTPKSEAMCVECPNNQLFNAKRQSCDQAYRVDCDM